MQQPLAWGATRAASNAGSFATAPHAALRAQDGGTEQTQSTAVTMADALFSGIVRQAFVSQQWQVSALNNTLDWDKVQIENGSVTGNGEWQVDAIDETGGGAHLEGSLSFDLKSDAQTSNGFTEVSGFDTAMAGTYVFTGTFQSDQDALDFTARLSSSKSGGSIATEARYDVSLTSGGATSRVVSTSRGNVETPAYGFTRVTSTGMVERDGNTSEWTNVTTTRSYGQGDSEIWREMDAPGGDAGPTHLVQHSSQRIAGDNVSQYVDQLDLAREGKSYRLEKPGSVTGTLDGDFTSDLVLVDGDGNKVELSKPDGGGRLPGLSSPLRQAASGRAGGISPEEAAFLLTMLGIGLFALGTGGAGLLLAGASPALLGEGIFAGSIIAGGAGAAGIIRAANADPYFVQAAMRPNSDPIGPSGVQITHVTGGLIPTPPASPSSTASSTLSGGVAGGTGLSNDPASGSGQPYDDDPVPFVGGSLPKGAQAIGEWTWDRAMQYGAMPSHTQAASDGPQMHYFLHAASSLKPGPDSNIVQYVYLDPANVPAELYMQFYTGKGDGEHRAYWGDSRVQTGGNTGTSSLLPMGNLPPAGGWVRLSIPAGKVGLADAEVNGVLYGLYGGKAWWGPTTTSNRLVDNAASVETVEAPPIVLTTTPGAQIAYKLASPMQIIIEIADAGGKKVRTLQGDTVETTGGYHIAIWDAKDDKGSLVPDAAYTVRFLSGGNVVAESPVTITPLVANILAPAPMSLVRGDQVPVIAEAYGDRFSHYTLEYGEGISPSTWISMTESSSPTLLPTGGELKQFNPGNLANWNVGIDEFKPWHDAGLSGVYTLRLRVTGVEGQQAVDTKTVIVGRLAHTAEEGVITSPDGKARLTVPALATTEAFALMAVIPTQQLEFGDGLRSILPPNDDLAGDLYELLPAGGRFRRPATLELPYSGGGDPGRVGIMMGDGTRDGWRYIGGVYDAQKGVVSVPVLSFGGERALAGVFASGNFGPPPADPAANAHIQIAATDEAPLITSAVPPSAANGLFAFYSDLESSPGEWESLDISGAQISRVTGAEAGVDAGNSVLKVTRQRDGVRLVRVRSTSYNATLYPIVSFDYRLPGDYVPDMFVRSGDTWWQISLGVSAPVDTEYFKHVDALKLENDGEWHHYSADIAALLENAGAQGSPLQIDEIVLGQFEKRAYMQVVAADSGGVGSSYYIDNFAALAPTNAGSLHVEWTAPPGASFSAYSVALDSDSSLSPEGKEQIAGASSDVSLPPDMTDGLYYYHVAGKDANGRWSRATHLPILLDRTAPSASTATYATDGGVDGLIQIPLSDATGIAPDSLRLKLGGQTYGVGRGLTYDSLLQSMEVAPAALQPPVAAFKGGNRVELTLLEASDRAGNKLQSSATLSFTADNGGARDSKFRQLTVKGGSEPSLSPDGQTLAFVSARGGSPKIWLMSADDFEEKSGSARPLTGVGGSGREGAPAWSPDGQTLAFVSDASGLPQVWLANADGQEARALTTGDGGAASPTWLSDGSRIVFVRDGNLWSVKPDGGEPQPITSYPERPITSVSAQPAPSGQLLVVGFKLYQETIETYNMATGELRPLTEGGRDREPAWLDGDTILFTAPSGAGSGPATQDSIWQVGAYGGKAEPLDDSAPAGVSDSKPSTVSGRTARQDLLAIVSNRAGSGNIWLRQSEGVGRLEVAPTAGAATGEATTMGYVLPSDATVTLRVLDSGGAVVRSLFEGQSMQAGPQEAEWDGKDDGGQDVAPGDYTVSLEAKATGGAPVTRYAMARRIAATGTLQLTIEQWKGQSADADAGLRVAIYPAGTRTHPAAASEANSSPHFELPVGAYDAVVEYRGVRHEERGIQVNAGESAQVTVDLGLGGLQPALFSGEGQALSAAASIEVSRAGDPNALPLQTGYSPGSLALPPGTYDVRVQYGSISALVRGVTVARGEIAQPEINLNSGLVLLQVYARDGEPAETGGRLLVQAVDPRDHTKIVSSAYLSNPAELPLPEGTYDLKVEYGTAAQGQEGFVFGTVTRWTPGVQVRSGQTLNQDFNLKLTPVTISLLDAPGKQVPTGAVAFRVSPVDAPGVTVASVLTDTARLELPEGRYSVVADYKGTDLKGSGPLRDVISVKYGQPAEHEISLGVGHITVEVRDGEDRLVAADGLSALAYPAGERDAPFATAFDANPVDLPVRGGVDYDVVLRLDDGRSLTLSGQRVAEGEELTLKAALQEFK
jgi:flagellar hook assembly protein FlgD